MTDIGLKCLITRGRLTGRSTLRFWRQLRDHPVVEAVAEIDGGIGRCLEFSDGPDIDFATQMSGVRSPPCGRDDNPRVLRRTLHRIRRRSWTSLSGTDSKVQRVDAGRQPHMIVSRAPRNVPADIDESGDTPRRRRRSEWMTDIGLKCLITRGRLTSRFCRQLRDRPVVEAVVEIDGGVGWCLEFSDGPGIGFATQMSGVRSDAMKIDRLLRICRSKKSSESGRNGRKRRKKASPSPSSPPVAVPPDLRISEEAGDARRGGEGGGERNSRKERRFFFFLSGLMEERRRRRRRN